jgi:WhiB family redox-sensing transcriptional regulator
MSSVEIGGTVDATAIKSYLTGLGDGPTAEDMEAIEVEREFDGIVAELLIPEHLKSLRHKGPHEQAVGRTDATIDLAYTHADYIHLAEKAAEEQAEKDRASSNGGFIVTTSVLIGAEKPKRRRRLTSAETGHWQDDGNCAGANQDIFFPGRGEDFTAGKAVCEKCVVKEKCLEFAFKNGEKFGIWGGMTERERKRIRKQRKDTAASIIGS